jgi:hypothetical protein
MTNMTLSIPEDLIKIMRKHTHIKWSEVARRAMWEEARKLELMDKILTNSSLTEKDVMALDKKVKRGIAKAHGIA